MNTPNSHGFPGQGNPETFPSPFSGYGSGTYTAAAGITSTTSAAGTSSAGGGGVQLQKGKNKRLKELTRQHGYTDVAGTSKPKIKRKPDPSTPNVTAPCSECGRRFWSQKALFGHMRCHPERQWRGINPPPHFRRRPHLLLENHHPAPPQDASQFLDVEHEVAACLVMLANGPTALAVNESRRLAADMDIVDETTTTTTTIPPSAADLDCRFECSSCKKMFGSHQALGGHRATHKNVKGCFAIARNDGGEEEGNEHNYCSSSSHNNDCAGGGGVNDGKRAAEGIVMMGSDQYRCNVCWKGFSSGRALGGHKRCHWERGDEHGAACGSPSSTAVGYVLDLNLPPPAENDGSVLDLKLGV